MEEVSRKRVVFHWLSLYMMPEVEAIEKRAFLDPWKSQDFENISEDSHIKVIMVETVVAGYMCYRMRPGEVELIRGAVHSGYRRQGYGTMLLEETSSRGRPLLWAYVNEDWDMALPWLASYGMKAVSTKRDHFPRGRAAYRFELFRQYKDKE